MIDRMRPVKRLRKGIIILPSAFTMSNLFFGFYAIVATTRGGFRVGGVVHRVGCRHRSPGRPRRPFYSDGIRIR